MRKYIYKLLAILLLASVASGIEIDNFQTDMYSKTGAIKPVVISLDIIGDDLDKAKLLDSLNTVISGFFYEDIFTQQGKENLKSTIIKYAAKKHSQNIDEVLIIKLRSNDDAQVLKRLEELLNKSKAKESTDKIY